MTPRRRVRDRLAFGLLAIVLMSIASATDTRSDARSVNHVTQFLSATENAMKLAPGAQVRTLMRVYRGALDLSSLAARVAPSSVWARATRSEKRQFAATLACRLAVETARRGARERRASWSVIGTRAERHALVVAVRVVRAQGDRQTVLFDVASRRGARRILDIRSAQGRLSVRLRNVIRQETQALGAAYTVERWLKQVACRM